MKTRLLAVAVATALLAPMGAFAQNTSSSSADALDLDELVVVGQRPAPPPQAALPMQVLGGDELAHRRQGGLGETLAGMPGVHLDNFGGGASRPVIRGQTLPRIEILSDGANLFDVSSVSPDHAITTDPLLLDAIEVQRGPAAVSYGGNASNGAINLIDSKVPKTLPDGGLTGATEVRYGSGDEEKTAVGRVTTAIGRLALHAEGARRDADNYDLPGGFGRSELRDSFAESTSYAFGASWITDKGYIGAAYTRVENQYGLPGHSHANGVCHLHGYLNPNRVDLHCVGHGRYQNPFDNPDSDTASIDLRSERVDVRGDYVDPMPWLSHLRIRGSYTDYQHDEIDGPILYSRYTNEVRDGRIELTHEPLFGFTGTFGVQYTEGEFSGLNLIDLHVPTTDSFGFEGTTHYDSETIGIFLSERRSFGDVDVEIAARKDWRSINVPIPGPFFSNVRAEDEAVYEQFYGPDWLAVMEENRREGWYYNNPERKHDPFSASLGATWHIDDGYSMGLSFARTERAPNMRELFAYGSNLATNSYEVGMLSDRMFIEMFFPDGLLADEDVLETTRSTDLILRRTGGPFEFEIGAFRQDVKDYIFPHYLETELENGVPHHFLVYTAVDAEFYGLDGQVSYRFAPASRVTVFGDYVETRLKGNEDNLPRIPPARLGVRYDHDAGPWSGDVEYVHTFEQDEIASYETQTRAYDMLNATLSYRVELDDRKNVEFYVRGTNLTNELAFVHTSFVKDQSPLRGRSIAFGIRHQF